MSRVKVDTGVVLPVEGHVATRENMIAVAREAERLNAHSVWATDRMLLPAAGPGGYPYSTERGAVAFDPAREWLEPVSVLSLVAGVTTRVQLGTNVLVLPYRHPVVLAQEWATLDRLSEGRAMLGVGIGWMEEEFEALGIPMRERGRRTDESIGVLRALWGAGAPTSFSGSFTAFTNMALASTPVQPGGPPILVGGNSTPALRRVAKLGDGWVGADLTPSVAAQAVAEIRGLCAEYGRDPDAMVYSARRRVEPSETTGQAGRDLYASLTPQLVNEVGQFVEGGINLMVIDVLMMPDMIEAVQWLFEEVLG